MTGDPRSITLRDDRTLSYAEYGNPAGTPLLFFHGTPGSRRWALPAWQDRSGPIRIIAPDRPGMGGSTFQPGRRLLDWPNDVVQLADALGLERFAVAGVSGGGPHALACAYALPDRVRLAASLSGAGPIEGGDSLKGMHAANRAAFTLAMRAPWLLQVFMVPSLYLAEHFPDRYAKGALKALPEADRQVLTDPQIRQVLKVGAREAVAHGPRGVLHEARIFVQPWGFHGADIKVPVLIWQGTADRNVPLAMVEQLAAEIPDAELKVYEGEGHMLFISHWAEISETIAGRLRAAG